MIAAAMIMEISIASLILGWVWVAVAGSPWPAPWLILLSGPLSFGFGKLAPVSWRRLNWFDPVWWATVAIVVAVLAEAGNATAAGTPSGMRWNVQFVAGLLLAWRGWALADGWIDLEFVESELQVGTIVVLGMLVILIWAAPGAGLLPAVTFAAAGLYGLGLARRSQRRAPGSAPEQDWLVLVGGLVGLIVLVAIVVVVLVTPDVLSSFMDQVHVGANLALVGIGALFQWIASFFPSFGPTGPQQLPPSGPIGPLGPAPAPTVARPAGDVPFFWVFELLITFALALFLFFGIRAVMKLMKTNIGSIGFSLPKQREPSPAMSAAEAFSWATWWQVFLRWLRGEVLTGNVFRPSAARTSAAGGGVLDGTAQQSEQRTIRALYREFLTAVARAGFERRPATTPNELAHEVNRARPVAAASIETVTELYVRTRYGEEQPGADELSRMREAVQQARRDLAPPEEPKRPRRA
ncbi:MAG: DUF4129 domain-containing protein [Chloroflexi bacterium]|nr:DUF4129 domain-containing protein [Chloroflexota bacterium]